MRNQTIKLLLEKRPDVAVYEFNDRNENPIEMARKIGSDEAVQLLEKHAESTGQSPPSDNVVNNEAHVHEGGTRNTMKPKGGVRKLTVKRGNES